MGTAKNIRLLFALIVFVYLSRLAAQAAVTPFGEGLDFYGHLAYIVFMADQGRPPAPDELTTPDWLRTVRRTVPGPDMSMDGERYHAWARMDPAAREQTRTALQRVPSPTAYTAINGMSQHPPLYYRLLSWFYRAFPAGLPLDARVYALTLLSIGLSALALPGLFRTFRLYLDPTTSLLCLLAVAVFPNTLAFLGRITNDALAMPLLVWGLYLSLRARASTRPAHWIGAGVLLLAASFTKTYALTLLPLYVFLAAWGQRGQTWRNLAIAAPLVVIGVTALFAFNVATTGYLIPLTEMRFTSSLPLTARVGALFNVDPLWFAGGLIKGFWWFGDWSFVWPGLVLALPLVLAAYAFVARPRPEAARRDWFDLQRLWPHYAAIALFMAGMWQHAALFTLDAQLTGKLRHSGNEGWYANVLIGCVFVILVCLLQRRVSEMGLRRVLAGVVVFFVAWSLLAQAALFTYWSGQVEVIGRLRAVPWDQFFRALFDPRAWQSWGSLPGLIQPLWLTFLLPLLASLGCTALALWRLRPAASIAVAAPSTAPTARSASRR